jgi:hypothetical protein
MATTITSIKAGFGKAGDAISVVGTGFLDAGSKSVILCRKHGDTAWTVVDPSRVAYVSATAMTLTAHATEFDAGGLWDIGVADNGESTPDAYLSSALFFYTGGADEPDNVVVGAALAVYVGGQYMGDFSDAIGWTLSESINKIFSQHSSSPIKTFPGEVSCELTVPLIEASLENFQIVLGASAPVDLGNGTRRITFGGRVSITDEEVLMILPGPTGYRYAATFYRCNIGFDGDITIGKEKPLNIPMKITVLADTSRLANDQLGNLEKFPII